MIKTEKRVVEAVCDACGKNMVVTMQGHSIHNYGELVPSFGHGSPLRALRGLFLQGRPRGGPADPRHGSGDLPGVPEAPER